ncbi:hypothetical protein FB451DRAFT_1045514, partial [Mycena latifolia]
KNLNSLLDKFLCGIVRHSPDTYLAELQEILEDRLGVDVHESTLWRSLQRCGFTMKKVIIDIQLWFGGSTSTELSFWIQLTRLALERSEAKRVAFRYEYGSKYTAEQTVFVDESSFDRRTSIRGKAWALSGERAQRKCFFVRGRRCATIPTVFPALNFFSDILCSLRWLSMV